MRGWGPRHIEPEILETLAPEQAARSLGDLRRINRLTGGHWILRRLLRRFVRREEAFSFLDVGSATGDMGDAVRRAFPNARVTSLDRTFHHVARAHPPRVNGDAFRLPFAPGSFDFVFCSLFLHHFSNDDVVRLLRSFGAVARRSVLAIDLERNPIPYWFLPATAWLLGWDRVTRHDGPISVQAAWRKEELRELACAAGLRQVRVSVYRPSFRVVLTGGASPIEASRAGSSFENPAAGTAAASEWGSGS
jgi:SAM-dependent methyltransferase